MTLYSLHNYHNDESWFSARTLGCVIIAIGLAVIIFVICLVARVLHNGLVMKKSNTEGVSTIESYTPNMMDLTKEANREDTFEA